MFFIVSRCRVFENSRCLFDFRPIPIDITFCITFGNRLHRVLSFLLFYFPKLSWSLNSPKRLPHTRPFRTTKCPASHRCYNASSFRLWTARTVPLFYTIVSGLRSYFHKVSPWCAGPNAAGRSVIGHLICKTVFLLARFAFFTMRRIRFMVFMYPISARLA